MTAAPERSELQRLSALADLWEEYAATLCGGCDSCDGARRQAYLDNATALRDRLAGPAHSTSEPSSLSAMLEGATDRLDLPASPDDPAEIQARIDALPSSLLTEDTALVDLLAERLGEHPEARNHFDITDEATTMLPQMAVEDIARWLVPALADERRRAGERARDAVEQAVTETPIEGALPGARQVVALDRLWPNIRHHLRAALAADEHEAGDKP